MFKIHRLTHFVFYQRIVFFDAFQLFLLLKNPLAELM